MKTRKTMTIAVASAAVLAMAGAAAAAPLNPFTQDELDLNWEKDRHLPADYEIVEAFGAANALKFTVDPAYADVGTNNDYHRNEGIRAASPDPESVEVALYLDPAWEGTAVRAGFWVVGDDGSDAWDDKYGIIEFTHTEVCDADDCLTNPRNVEQDHAGFRIWETGTGWTEHLDTEFEYGTWVTLGIEIDVDEQLYIYTIDGVEVGTAGAGENGLHTVFLQTYNFADDNFENLSSDGYAVHWANEAPVIEEPINFPDVSDTNQFKDEIEWLAGTGITGGYEDGTFRPTSPVTRQAMAAFLFRWSGANFVAPTEPTFSDVAPDHPFYREIEMLADIEVTDGYDDGTFRPTNRISRQAMAAFLFRGFDTDTFDAPAEATFSDVAPDHPFFTEIEWLADTGVTGGYEDGTFRGGANVTRQAMAAFLFRADGIL